MTSPVLSRDADILEQTVLGSYAAYRVLRREREYVEVEVIEAPGMKAGEQLRFSAAAVHAMASPREHRRTRRHASTRVQPSAS